MTSVDGDILFNNRIAKVGYFSRCQPRLVGGLTYLHRVEHCPQAELPRDFTNR
jgi:hypothetical protein